MTPEEVQAYLDQVQRHVQGMQLERYHEAMVRIAQLSSTQYDPRPMAERLHLIYEIAAPLADMDNGQDYVGLCDGCAQRIDECLCR